MLTSLLTLLGGGLMRCLPEIMNLLNKKTDNLHEIAMLEKQIELEKLSAGDKLAASAQQGVIEQAVQAMVSQGEALKAQMQVTGNKFVDGLNFLVRPLVTYLFLGMFCMYKCSMMVVALSEQNVWQAVLAVYSADDSAMLMGILSFWFVGRVFDKK